jgi:DNA repair protein RadC
MAAVPAHERPRERMLQRGIDTLSERELLALVLRHGRGGASALDVADELLARYGTLAAVASAPPEQLAACPGVGLAKASALAAACRIGRLTAQARVVGAVLRTGADVAAACRHELADCRRERVVALVCDAANRHRHTVVISEGAVDRSLLPTREVLTAVLRLDGRSFALAHNHPSGDPEPSDADVRATATIAAGATATGLRFLGHVVVAGRSWRLVA